LRHPRYGPEHVEMKLSIVVPLLADPRPLKLAILSDEAAGKAAPGKRLSIDVCDRRLHKLRWRRQSDERPPWNAGEGCRTRQAYRFAACRQVFGRLQSG